MPGLNKYNEKERRQARRNFHKDHTKADLRTPKYRKQVIPDKRRDVEKYLEDLETRMVEYLHGEWIEDWN